jgi:hypothetical protein
VTDTDARLWHPWLRINRLLRVMLQTRWSAEAWSQVRVEFRKALALRSGDPARGVVQLGLMTDQRGPTAHGGARVRQVLDALVQSRYLNHDAQAGNCSM